MEGHQGQHVTQGLKHGVIVNNGKTLTLGGNDGVVAGGGAQAAGAFTGLGNITLGSGGGGSILTINLFRV